VEFSGEKNGKTIGWMEMACSLKGCVMLIKSTLSSLSSYYSSLFPISMGVARCIKKLQKDFLEQTWQ
jgi:hypothetical protein